MRVRIATVGAGIIMGAALVAGCGSSGSKGATPTTSSSTSTSTTAGDSTTTAAATAVTVNVTVGDTAGLGGPMTLKADTNGVPAGDVTFIVTNTGTIDHEMVVLRTDTAFDKIPVSDAGDPPAQVAVGADKIAEENNVGETGDPNLKPGTTRTFTIKNMQAGKYALVCNIAQHYGLGMRAALLVT